MLFVPFRSFQSASGMRWRGLLFAFVLVGLLVACGDVSGPTPEPSQPVSSPDMPGALAYVHGGDLWVRQGGQATQLTSGGGVTYPRWSPDGSALLYLRGYPGEGKELWLWTLGLDEPQRLGPETLHASGRPRWAPDSMWVAFVPWSDDWRQPDEGVVAVSVRGDVTQVLPPGSGATDLAWHPDGWLAVALRARPLDVNNPFSRTIEQQRQAIIIKAMPGAAATDHIVLARLGTPPRDGSFGMFIESAGGLRFDPNGAWLTFFAYPNSASLAADGVDLQAVPTAGGELQTLVTMLAYDDFLAWSPDGTRLAVVQGVGRDVGESKELAILAAGDFHTIAMLTPPGQVDLTPAWSPDGFIVASSRGPSVASGGAAMSRHIWLSNLETGEGSPLLSAASPDLTQDDPVWGAYDAGLLFVQQQTDSDGMGDVLWLPPGGTDATRVGEIGPADGYYGHVRWHDLIDWMIQRSP